nr:MAG TPA: hypothetical protein [Caudoviricetes sp.]
MFLNIYNDILKIKIKSPLFFAVILKLFLL